MSLREGIIQARTFLQLCFVKGLSIYESLGGLAASEPHRINFISNPGRAAYRKSNVTFG
jgi:hypothetical protein